MESLGQDRRRLDLRGRPAEALRRLLLDALRLVGLQDLPLPLAEHLHQGVEAGAQSGDLAGIEVYRPRQFLFGQFAHVPVGQHVFEGAGKQVGRRLPGAGQILRVVFLIGVNHTADGNMLLLLPHTATLRELRRP